MNPDNPSEPDTRNVSDKYRGQTVESIVADLDTSRSQLEIAVENLERDFNMGTIIRNANAFNVKKVHIIGRKQWNKRGAMKTDAYLHLAYYQTAEDFFEEMKKKAILSNFCYLSRSYLSTRSVTHETRYPSRLL